jgi:hypothetical protein
MDTSTPKILTRAKWSSGVVDRCELTQPLSMEDHSRKLARRHMPGLKVSLLFYKHSAKRRHILHHPIGSAP